MDFRRAEVPRVDFYQNRPTLCIAAFLFDAGALPANRLPDFGKGGLDKLPNTMGLPRRQHVVIGIRPLHDPPHRSEEHTSELQSLMRISYAVFCLKKKNTTTKQHANTHVE